MPSPPLRIAVLECDTPLSTTNSKYGGYGGVFNALLSAAADALETPNLSSKDSLDLTTWNVLEAQTYPSLDDIDAILISGSKYNSFDDTPWIVKLVDFTKKVLAQERVRIIGVCFGHQIVGRAMDVKVGRSLGGWEASVTAIDLTKRGQEIFGLPALVCCLPPLPARRKLSKANNSSGTPPNAPRRSLRVPSRRRKPSLHRRLQSPSHVRR